MAKVKPFIKIPGGKYSLLDTLIENLPSNFNNIDTYIEPFLGGGSFFLNLPSTYTNLKNFYVNELNRDLFQVWDLILNNPIEEVETGLKSHLSIFKSQHNENNEYYYKIRDSFNATTENSLKKIAQFLYLNKTCYNGLIRYNSKHKFNSPLGSYTNPPIEDTSRLKDISNLLNNKSISSYNMDFQLFLENLKKDKILNKNSFVYLDPPYVPQSITANFTSYNSNNFTEYDQYRLLSILHLIDSSGSKFMISNSDTPLTRSMYSNFNIIEIMNNRSINCKKVNRGKIKELIVKNY